MVFKKGEMKLDIERQHLISSSNEDSHTTKMIEELLRTDNAEDLKKQITDKGFDSINRVSAKGTILHQAVEAGAIKCLDVIPLEKPLVDAPNKSGDTAFLCALRKVNVEIVKKILKWQVFVDARNNHGECGLHILANAIDIDDNEDVLKCLVIILDNVPMIDLEAQNNEAFTPLLRVAKEIPTAKGNHKEALISFGQMLVSKGASLDAKDKNGYTCRKWLENGQALHSVISKGEKSPPNRSIASRLFDALILDDCVTHVFKSCSQKVAKEASNFYLGDMTVLFYAVDNLNEDAVDGLLDAGANPWKEQISGDLCIHRALSRGHLEILEKLIQKMKRNENDVLDLRDYSFTLFEKFLVNYKNGKSENPKENYYGCLQRMFNKRDIQINVNAHSGKVISQSILYMAATYNNQEAVRLLLANGAFLGCKKTIANIDSGSILPGIRGQTIERAMDKCISHHSTGGDNGKENFLSSDYTLKLDFKFLVQQQGHKDDENSTTNLKESEVLMQIIQSKEHRNVVKHPLIQALIDVKWSKVINLYRINITAYLLFVAILAAFLYNLKDLRILEERMESDSSNYNESTNASMTSNMERYKTTVNVLMPFLLLITFGMVVREVFQMIFTLKTYHKNIENLFEWILIFLVFILCSFTLDVDTTRHLAGWASIIAGCEFVLLLGRVPRLAIYMTMLRQVSVKFMWSILLYGALLLTFAFSFSIILQPTLPDGDFSSFWRTLPKTIVMTTGEFEYSNLSGEISAKHPAIWFSAVLMLLVFLFLLFLVVMNIMNGMAVKDAKDVLDDALQNSMTSRIEFIYLIETLLTSACLGRLRQMVSVISGDKLPTFLVRLNEENEARRITLKTESGKEVFCSLDDAIVQALREHRMEKSSSTCSHCNSPIKN